MDRSRLFRALLTCVPVLALSLAACVQADPEEEEDPEEPRLLATGSRSPRGAGADDSFESSEVGDEDEDAGADSDDVPPRQSRRERETPIAIHTRLYYLQTFELDASYRLRATASLTAQEDGFRRGEGLDAYFHSQAGTR